MRFWDVMQDAIVGTCFIWIIWILFSSLRRYLIAKTRARLHEKLLERINSAESLVTLASSDAGRQFLDSIALESAPPERPFGRVLFAVQAGMVLLFFGLAMLSVHHFVYDPEGGFMIVGTGAIGLGIGFLAASAASIAVSQRLGLLSRERNG